MKLTLVTAILIIVTVIATGCGASMNIDDNTELRSSIPYSVGERVEYGLIAITLQSVRFDRTSDNQRLLIIDSLIENNGARDLPVSVPAMFMLLDEQNYIMDEKQIANTRGNLNTVISPGRKIAGEIAYVVDENAEQWELIFSPRKFSFQEAGFSITLDNLR